MTTGFLNDYYKLEKQYGGKTEYIPESELKVLRWEHRKDEALREQRVPNFDKSDYPDGDKNPRKEKFDELHQQVCELWLQGYTTQEIVAKTGKYHRVISNYLKRDGLKPRVKYKYKITKGDEVMYFNALAKAALAVDRNIRSLTSNATLVRAIRKHGWYLEVGDFRETGVEE
jgi:hypothetical protein